MSTTVTPKNRMLTACQKIKVLAGHTDISKYVNQIIMAAAYIEMNYGRRL